MKSPQEILKKYWGYDIFRPLQEDVITSIMQGHDTMVLLPTGGGKSICYQVPALCMEGICIVVSPLIALMKDQVQRLNDMGIRSACLVSGLKHREVEIILNNCVSGRIKLLYVSPERIKNAMFQGHLRQMKVSMVAIDEAHCISQWGFDFRPAYLDVCLLRQLLPSIPFLALTATATPRVISDIAKVLSFQSDYRLFKSSFRRDNLSYVVFCENDKQGRLLRILDGVKGSAIIYVRNRRLTVEVARFLNGHKVSAVSYHAGMEPRDRDRSQALWMQNQARVMVATNAFGMGIDKSDVRLVVHLDLPSSIEAYYQEAGRAGRDGRRAYAVILANEADRSTLQASLSMSYPDMALIRNVYRALGNFYQVPVGSGEGCAFDFDMERICSTYGFNPVVFYGALRLLEKEGLVMVPDRPQTESSLTILIRPDEVYRFQMENVRYGDLLAIILRLYGGLYSSFVPISERTIAGRYPGLDEHRVMRMLQHLDALKVVSYKPKSSKPQLVFVSPRIDDATMLLSDEVYANQQRLARERLDKMIDYVFVEQQCRSQFMLDYLGEENPKPCGMCDLCLARRKKSVASLREDVVSRLKEGDCELKSLVSSVVNSSASTPIGESEVVESIRQLVDEGVVSQSADFVLRYIGER